MRRDWFWVGLLLTAGCQKEPVAAPQQPSAGERPGPQAAGRPSQDLNPRLLRRFKPLHSVANAEPPPSGALVDLGRMLYFDKRLSRTQEVSCESCHPLASYGATPDSVSTGVHGRKGTRNAPSTFHASGHLAQFWDGRVDTIEEQAQKPILNPVEMDMQQREVVAILRSIPGYVDAFKAAFPTEKDPVTYDNLGRAIGGFERGLVTPSRWDKYLMGDSQALTELEKDGLKLFTNTGCLVCHTGELVGGSMYEKVGKVEPWPNQADKGRGALTGVASEDMVFKVPSLRNVAKTAPYFHDGSAKTLDQAIRMMARYQVDEPALTDDEVQAMVAWMGSLTGELPTSYIAAPALPPNGPKTPRPQVD